MKWIALKGMQRRWKNFFSFSGFILIDRNFIARDSILSPWLRFQSKFMKKNVSNRKEAETFVDQLMASCQSALREVKRKSVWEMLPD